ncbi:TonB-dependent receptor [Sulfurimonas sp. HSL1-6]|uniref:TonB-dependent receptor n=1 Tax=Thiomicrolovo immobilis TaxID=3131935 RepID=UPI0031F893A5
MNINHLAKSTALLCFLLGNSAAIHADESIAIGAVTVESTTIDDGVDSKTGVSNTMTITGEEVEKINPHTITDILNSVPGVTLSNVGTDSVKVHIRGIENQMYMGEQPGVAIVIDGVPVQETSGKINIDLDNIESIKVIKGGASYLYGNDALAGAVIITTKKAKAVSSSKAEAEAGSFNSKRLMATTNQSFENSALQLQGSYRGSDGYWDESYVSVKSINGKYSYYLNDTSDITLGLDYTKRETGDGNSVHGTLAAKTDPRSENEYSYSGYYKTDLTKGFVTYSNSFGEDSNLMLNVHTYIDDKTYKTARTKTDKNEIWNQNGAKGEYRTAFDILGLMTGFDLQRNTTDERAYLAADGSLQSDYATEEDINALYGEMKLEVVKDLTTTFNIRYDNIQQRYIDHQESANNVKPSYDVVSYRAGFNYALSKNNALYASVSTGFRTPTVRQMSNNQATLRENPAVDIPSKIGIETSYNYEIGLRGRYAGLTYNASVYQLDRKDYIGRIAGSYITSDDENESNYDNVGDMRSRGFELSVQSDRSKTVAFDLAYTYLDAVFTRYWLSQQVTADPDGRGPLTGDFERIDLSGNQVPRTPKHTVKLTLYYQPNSKATLITELLAKSSYYADEVNAHKLSGYEVVNLIGEYRFSDAFEMFARFDNLLDRKYYQFVNINSSALATMAEDATVRVAPPRAFYAGMRYRF